MNHIITFAIIVFVIIFAIVLAKGTSFSAFFSDSISFFKGLLRKNPTVPYEKENKCSRGTTGLYERVKNEKAQVFLTGKSAKEGIQTQITVYDHDGRLIGAKNVCVNDSPLMIGRGTDSAKYESKLCLPDISDEPTTSRMHCILTRAADSLILKDCYDRDSAFDNYGNQIHSVSNDYKTNAYVGNGFVIEHGESKEVNIGDYVLKISNSARPSLRGVPTYGYKATHSAPTRDAEKSAPMYVPTKEYRIK